MRNNIQVEHTRLFVKVVQCGGFTRAAELLKIPKSTISKAVTHLEQATETKLLLRTTRSMTLTAAGRAFYETCAGPLQTLEDAQRSLFGQDSILSGQVRITAPEDLGSIVIAPAIAALTAKNPALTFDLHYTDEVVDLVKDGFDLAVRIGKLKDSNLRARKAGEILLGLVASPDYLNRHEKIRTPDDLTAHSCLTISARTPLWQLRSKSRSLDLNLAPRIVSNQMTSLLNMALAGAGVAFVPLFLCAPEVAAGSLERVLPEWNSAPLTVSLASPAGTSSSARLKVVTEHLFLALHGALNHPRK